MERSKYTAKLKIWCVKQIKKGKYSLNKISNFRNIPKSTLHKWCKCYELEGESFTIPKKIGRPEKQINPAFVRLTVSLWYIYKCSSHKLYLLFKDVGFGVSQRQIQKIYNEYNLKMSKRKRPSQIKFVKYERKTKDELWHTDWTTCPITGKQLIAFIDDYSRFIIHAEYFEQATAENTILAFFNAITKSGKPKEILTDNGTQFTASRNRGAGTTLFEQFCKQNKIKHILGRIHHPQTNGKIERWFGTYKLEYDERFNNIEEYISFYNEMRLHQGINYQVPAERYIDNFKRSPISV